jgi:hypothetical protein
MILLLLLSEMEDGRGWKVSLTAILEIGEDLLQSQEARTGITVRVQEGHWKSKFGGMRGTVEHKWGHPDYPALDVRLEDGRLELFWFHELDEASEN